MTSAAHVRSPRPNSTRAIAIADDEHQQPRVGHVVAERALRPLAEVVVVQDAVLHDAERRR